MRMLPVFVEMGGPDVVFGTLPEPLGLWASTKVGFTSIHGFYFRQRKRMRISTPLPHSERKSRVFLLLCSLAMTGKIFSSSSHSEGGEE